MTVIQYVGLVEKWFQCRGNDQKVHHTSFQRTKLLTTLDACVYTASRFKGAVFSAVLSRRNVLRFRMLSKRLLSSLQELALSLRFLGACLRFPFFRWILFSPLNTCHLTAVPKNRRVQYTRWRFVLTFFRVRSHSFSYDPVSAFQWIVKNSPTRNFPGGWAFHPVQRPYDADISRNIYVPSLFFNCHDLIARRIAVQYD